MKWLHFKDGIDSSMIVPQTLWNVKVAKKMTIRRRARSFLPLLLCLVSFPLVLAEDGDLYNYNDDDNAAADDDRNGAQAVNDDAVDDGQQNMQQYNDDNIQYWTDYAILPKRCIAYNYTDSIVFSLFENGYKQCSENPIGTYVTPVSTFLNAYMAQIQLMEQDSGNDDYAVPDVARYSGCKKVVMQNQEYWATLGCTDGTSQSLSVNVYSDNRCETRDEQNGSIRIDVTEVQLPFKSCQACVNLLDNEVDDFYSENRQTYSPLCTSTWQNKQECNKTCQNMGLEPKYSTWNGSDKILLTILSLFGAGMLIIILLMRKSMSNKEALLEEAAMSAAGLSRAHIVGLFLLVIVVITLLALVGLKNITWALLLIMDTFLFGYLMKLTVDSGVTVRADHTGDSSSFESVSHEARSAGTYRLPKLQLL